MTEHLREEQLERFRAHSLPAGELLSIGGHLAACADCRDRLGVSPTQLGARVAQLRESLNAREPTDHLAYEQLAAYADDGLNEIDREIVEAHLNLCARCEFEANELRSLAVSMRPAPRTVVTEAKRGGLTASLSTFFSTFFSPENLFARRTAFAAALVVLVIFAALFFLRAGRAPAPNIVKTLPTPDAPEGITTRPTPSPGPAASPTPDMTPLPSPTPAPQPSTLNDGGQVVTLAANGGVEGLGRLAPEDERAVARALATGRVELPAGLAELARGDGSLMGQTPAARSFEIKGPAGVVVRDARPAFSWKTIEGADSYVVTIYKAGYEEVATSPRLTANTWTPPQALARGRVYSWEVAAFDGGQRIARAPAPPASEARFQVLGEREARQLEATLARHPSSHLVRGTAYARAGLLADAEREFRTLLRSNPRSRIARRLLNSLRGN
ncbi:MAG TPA: zf-HC2 domain-containing protein [Pyrinomonadaceae bacterium]